MYNPGNLKKINQMSIKMKNLTIKILDKKKSVDVGLLEKASLISLQRLKNLVDLLFKRLSLKKI